MPETNEKIIKMEASEPLEIRIDHGHITIPLERYSQLLKAEIHLNIVHQIYHSTKQYDLCDRLSILFGPQQHKQKDESDA